VEDKLPERDDLPIVDADSPEYKAGSWLARMGNPATGPVRNGSADGRMHRNRSCHRSEW
jgi:hypothetical protein